MFYEDRTLIVSLEELSLLRFLAGKVELPSSEVDQRTSMDYAKKLYEILLKPLMAIAGSHNVSHFREVVREVLIRTEMKKLQLEHIDGT